MTPHGLPWGDSEEVKMKTTIFLMLGLFVAGGCGSMENKAVEDVDKVIKTDAEWQKLLTPEQFKITRFKATEPACTGIYDKNKEKGIYKCICCGTDLFL